MSEKPISPLRQRMLEDMNMRRFVPDTQREYIRAVKRLATFLGRSPDAATAEELRAFQLHLTETVCNHRASARPWPRSEALHTDASEIGSLINSAGSLNLRTFARPIEGQGIHRSHGVHGRVCRDPSATSIQAETLKQLGLLCGAGLLISLLLITYGLDLSPGFF